MRCQPCCQTSLPRLLPTPPLAPCSISWSPDGELLLAVNASSGGQPTTVLFKRQAWDTTHLVGHRSSVVAAAANPRMFFAPRRLQAARKAAAERMARAAEGDGSEDGEEQQQDDAAAAAAAGGDGLDGFDDMPSMVCACSSNDKTFTVWSSELALPVLHCQQVRRGHVQRSSRPASQLLCTMPGLVLFALALCADAAPMLPFASVFLMFRCTSAVSSTTFIRLCLAACSCTRATSWTWPGRLTATR